MNFLNLESAISTGIEHLRGLIAHDEVLQHIVAGVEGLDAILEKPAVQLVATSMFPCAIPAFKLLNLANAGVKAAESGDAVGVIKTVEDGAAVAGVTVPAQAQNVLDAAKKFAAASGMTETPEVTPASGVQDVHADPLAGLPGQSD